MVGKLILQMIIISTFFGMVPVIHLFSLHSSPFVWEASFIMFCIQFFLYFIIFLCICPLIFSFIASVPFIHTLSMWQKCDVFSITKNLLCIFELCFADDLNLHLVWLSSVFFPLSLRYPSLSMRQECGVFLVLPWMNHTSCKYFINLVFQSHVYSCIGCPQGPQQRSGSPKQWDYPPLRYCI